MNSQVPGNALYSASYDPTCLDAPLTPPGTVSDLPNSALDLPNYLAAKSSAEPYADTFQSPNNYAVVEDANSAASPFTSGWFTVGSTGQVSIDYLFDGGSYEGQLGIFSLSGLEQFAVGSDAFIQEAVRRVLSDSTLGHVVISDATEGARFSGAFPWEGDFNAGEYLGVKTVAMNPGDSFGVVMLPNGTFQTALATADFSGSQRPLFSLATANPNSAFQFGQIADVTGNGSTFALEDLSLDGHSDRDYNDIVFQIRGAIGNAIPIDQVLCPNKDWLGSEMGQALLSYIAPYDDPQTTQPVDYHFPTANQPLIGIVDTGFAANNPDIDYSHLILGKDYVDGDANPLLATGEGNEHGTHILGIIGATQNNCIGIDGINDQAPIWLGRAIGSGKWADSLVDFVNQALTSNQPHAAVNLSLDLTQINPDGSVTTRYEFTPEERAALEYARQSGVLIVAAAGNNGDVMSVLGQASQEFDNIITVGAADGFNRADYSSYGEGLDILAQGNDVLSTVGDGVGTLTGTSVATAEVTGAISQIWAANPGLSYRQVIEIVKATAIDLNTPGWDAETGAGLLDTEAAVKQALGTTPAGYNPEAFSTPETWSLDGKVLAEEQAVAVPMYPTTEPTSFTGRIFVSSAVVRSAPTTNSTKVGSKKLNEYVQFDAWTYGQEVKDYALGTPDRRWYRIAGTNQWISSAVVAGNAPGSTAIPPSNPGSSQFAWESAIDKEYARINQKPVAFNGEILNIGNPISGYQDAYTSPYGTSGKWREYHVSGGNPQDGGAIYWSPQYGAVSMWYGFLQKYQQNGGSNGKLGFPVQGEYDYTYQGHAGRRMDFEGGWMFWSGATGDLVFIEEPNTSIPQPFSPVYLKNKNLLGNPKGGVQTYNGIKYMQFDNGSIVSSKYGTYAISGAIRQKYLAAKGLAGQLGAPTSAAIDQGNGTKIQYFEGGYIFFNGKIASVYYTSITSPSKPIPPILSKPIISKPSYFKIESVYDDSDGNTSVTPGGTIKITGKASGVENLHFMLGQDIPLANSSITFLEDNFVATIKLPQRIYTGSYPITILYNDVRAEVLNPVIKLHTWSDKRVWQQIITPVNDGATAAQF